MSAARLEADLTAFTESFASLIRSARINEASDDIKRAQVIYICIVDGLSVSSSYIAQAPTTSLAVQAPGEVVEVLAERVVQVAQQLLQSTAELKRRAFLAHAGTRLATPEDTADFSSSGLQEHLGQLKADIERRLQVLLPLAYVILTVLQWSPASHQLDATG